MNQQKTGNGHTSKGNGNVHGRCPFSTLSKSQISDKLRSSIESALTPVSITNSISSVSSSSPSNGSTVDQTTFRPLHCPVVNLYQTTNHSPKNSGSGDKLLNSNNVCTISASSFDDSEQLPTPSPMADNGPLNGKVDLKTLSVALMKFLYPKVSS